MIRPSRIAVALMVNDFLVLTGGIYLPSRFLAAIGAFLVFGNVADLLRVTGVRNLVADLNANPIPLPWREWVRVAREAR